ncbi:disintegrin and metalloproteinase domain-containing protein 10-like isoform X2 [Magallana gigas]|uniref:disintegrin and metalloproteinase domain-containing protein 10-like isoform X2 n=1 Tax=Magallana gigas TaxID=29159 RepID=UPI00333F5463
MAIGLILFMGFFIKFCAVHTPSSNPNAKPALKLTDTLRRRRRQPEQQYRAQGPSGPPPPYSAHGGPPQGHRKGAGAKGGRYNNLEMRKV